MQGSAPRKADAIKALSLAVRVKLHMWNDTRNVLPRTSYNFIRLKMKSLKSHKLRGKTDKSYNVQMINKNGSFIDGDGSNCQIFIIYSHVNKSIKLMVG